MQERWQIKNTDNTQTKHNPEKQTQQNTAKQKLPWFGLLIQHLSLPLELHLTSSELWFVQEQEGILP